MFMSVKLSLIYILLFAGHFSDGQTLNSTCLTPHQIPGVCIRFKNCPSLASILRSKPLSADNIAYVRNSQCGYEGDDALGCCPRPVDVTRHRNVNLINDDVCGVGVTDRIRNGKVAQLFEYPWMVLLGYRSGFRDSFRCGGTLINKQYVLTAAHCVTGPLKLVKIRLGELDQGKPIDCVENDGDEDFRTCADAPQDVLVDTIVSHPNYSTTKLGDDIALVRLASPVASFTSSIRPVCLPVGLDEQDKQHDVKRSNGTPNKLNAAGWGVTQIYAPPSSVLMHVFLPVVSNYECAEKYRAQKYVITERQLCAGGGSELQDSCSGDSGGPLKGVALMEGLPRVVQYGVVSFGPKNCGTPGFPGVYTRVGYYMDWILDTIRP